MFEVGFEFELKFGKKNSLEFGIIEVIGPIKLKYLVFDDNYSQCPDPNTHTHLFGIWPSLLCQLKHIPTPLYIILTSTLFYIISSLQIYK